MTYPVAIPIKEITAETLDEWVRGCLEYYYWNDIRQGDKQYSVQWDEAHHPHPIGESESDSKVLLAYNHHQIHGLLQSEVEKRRCFWTGRAKAFLRSPEAKELPDYFLAELWQLYWKWVGVTRRVLKHPKKAKTTKRNRRVTPKTTKEKRAKRRLAKWADRVDLTQDRPRLVNFRLDCENLYQLDQSTAVEYFENTINTLQKLLGESPKPEEQSEVERQVLRGHHALILVWIDRFRRRAHVRSILRSLEQQRDTTAEPAVETTTA